MKNKILVEGQFGHGAVRRTKVGHFIQRLKRPKVGRSSIPFNWSAGYSSLIKIGTVPVKNQETSDSCGGQAGSYGMAIAYALQSGAYSELSAKSIYSLIFYPQGGTTEDSIENVFKRDGATLESEVPSYPATEQNLENTAWRNDALMKSALGRAGFKPLTVNLDIDSVAEAIRDYGFAIIQINGSNNGSWLSTNPKPPVSGETQWSHFLCFVEAKLVNNIKTLTAINSWGAEIGQNGLQFFTQDYFDAKAIYDCFTAQTSLPEPPASLQTDANRTTLTPQEESYFMAMLRTCAQLLGRLF